jgi:HlyD family secretion protein
VDRSDINRVTTGQRRAFRSTLTPGAVRRHDRRSRLNATQNSNVITYPVIIDVPNPDGKLKPKMTADVTIEVSRVQDDLRVPNAALRFKPIETGRGGGSDAASRAALEGTAARSRGTNGDPRHGGGAGPGGAGQGGGGVAAAADALASGQPGGKRKQVVYVVGANDGEVAVRTGITDGRFTAGRGQPQTRRQDRRRPRPQRWIRRHAPAGHGRTAAGQRAQ